MEGVRDGEREVGREGEGDREKIRKVERWRGREIILFLFGSALNFYLSEILHKLL